MDCCDRDPKNPKDQGIGASWLLLLLPLLCCGLPLLLSAGGAAAVLWAKGYGYAALGAIAVGLGIWALTRLRRSSVGRHLVTSGVSAQSSAGEQRPPRRAASDRQR